MNSAESFRIVVLPGDGIGVEVMDACLAALKALQQSNKRFLLHFEPHPGGAALYAASGTAFPAASMRACEAADAVLFGAMGLPHVRYDDGTEIAPQLELREHLELFAGVRPIRAIPGVPLPLADPRAAQIDFVLVREQTEGWFYGRNHTDAAPRGDEDTCYDLGRITRSGSERLFEFSFRLAQRRRLQRLPGLLRSARQRDLPAVHQTIFHTLHQREMPPTIMRIKQDQHARRARIGRTVQRRSRAAPARKERRIASRCPTRRGRACATGAFQPWQSGFPFRWS